MFNKDETLKEAVRKVILHHVFFSELLKQGKPILEDQHWVHSIVLGCRKDPDEVVGRMIRITAEASALLEMGFKELNTFTSEVEDKDEDNPAV